MKEELTASELKWVGVFESGFAAALVAASLTFQNALGRSELMAATIGALVMMARATYHFSKMRLLLNDSR